MEANWAIIPDINRIDESLALAEKYSAAFEYNDFFMTHVYENPTEVKRRINLYRSLPRFGSEYTLHGVFYDLAAISTDRVFRKHSRDLMEYSMNTAEELACKGVVFHSGLIGSFELDNYIQNWVDQMGDCLMELAEKHPGIEIYMENTFERKPDTFIQLMKKCEEVGNIKLCLDYAHAILTPVSVSEWVEAFKPYLGHVHINDNDLKNDMHCQPGKGAIDFNEFKLLMGDAIKPDSNVNTLIEVNGFEEQRAGLEYLGGL